MNGWAYLVLQLWLCLLAAAALAFCGGVAFGNRRRARTRALEAEDWQQRLGAAHGEAQKYRAELGLALTEKGKLATDLDGARAELPALRRRVAELEAAAQPVAARPQRKEPIEREHHEQRAHIGRLDAMVRRLRMVLAQRGVELARAQLDLRRQREELRRGASARRAAPLPPPPLPPATRARKRATPSSQRAARRARKDDPGVQGDLAAKAPRR